MGTRRGTPSQPHVCILRNTPATIRSAKEYSTTQKLTSDVHRIQVTAPSTMKGSPCVSMTTAQLERESSVPDTSPAKKMKRRELQLVTRRVDFYLCGSSWV